jgi:hypothetical protein
MTITTTLEAQRFDFQTPTVFEIQTGIFHGSDDFTDGQVVWVLADSANTVISAIAGTGATFCGIVEAKISISDIDYSLPEQIHELRHALGAMDPIIQFADEHITQTLPNGVQIVPLSKANYFKHRYLIEVFGRCGLQEWVTVFDSDDWVLAQQAANLQINKPSIEAVQVRIVDTQ